MKIVAGLLLCLAMVLSAAAQTAPSGQSAQPQPAPPFSEWLSNYYMAIRNNLTKSAEKMSEENYGMRPGPQQEVRTFGQILGHLANSNFFYCSMAKGEKNPATMDYEKATTKTDLVKGLNDAFAYCDAVYKSQSDASLMEKVTTTGANNRQVQFIRLTRLMQNVAHNNEHYGNLVTYFRIKSIVPPSSERR